MNLKEKILKLKKEKNALIVAHLYQRDEIQEIADIVGDSYFLSKKAMESDKDVIIFCGVKFMAESAKILSPNKKILIPSNNTTCPMADMALVDRLQELKDKHPNAKVVSYINSNLDIKALSDVCVTSSSAINILNNLDKNFKTLISSRAYLFQHQIDTIVRALKEDKVRLMFADEVGLGKTIEALVVLKGKGLNKALIIVPDSLVNQWKNEIYVKLWMDSYVYQGGELPKKGIVLVPFEILDNLNIEKIIDKYDFCIIDEVHRCL